ncbi:hypothetical protein ACFFJY_17955 [Fictibacillus aquaticus]|uniref:PepSY domain-containing protein n=1 Tax=Fictibacillus aquaticus TaxID=2021314 RepID=A0A235F5R7_9BACL|nr:hypothetical protein [Fictibacillus aquaticus]OYD56572.1 hypothetical protein CGZ90_16300 [Fictibacillus aquaticus]
MKMKKAWIAGTAAIAVAGAGIAAASSHTPFKLVQAAGLQSKNNSPEEDFQKEWEQKVQLTKEEAQDIACKMVSGEVEVVTTELDHFESNIVYDIVVFDGKTFKEVTLKANDGKVVNVAENSNGGDDSELSSP